jgi:hypothetical protein
VRTTALVIAAVVATPGVAFANRTFYGWLTNTEVLPERGAEVQSWLDEENGREPVDLHTTTWGFNGLIGVTDQLTFGFPLEMEWFKGDGVDPRFTLKQYGLEARYRLVSSDPEEAPPFAPLIRVAAKRDVIIRDAVVGEANFVLSTTTSSGSVHAVVDVGFVGTFTPDETHTELRPGAGVSFDTVKDLRLGAEVYALVSLDSKAESFVFAGPNLAWTQGRFWVSGAFGIGLYQLETAPRVTWGIMF